MRSSIRFVASAAAVMAVAVATFGIPANAARPVLPERLTHLAGSRQVVIVTAANWDTSYARLQTWQQSDDGKWHKELGPVKARIGWSGFRRAENRLQDTGKTPAGTFDLLRGFGLAKPSGVDLNYRVVDANDWWPYDPTDPKTYNVVQFHRTRHSQWRTSWAENLRSYRQQYRYAVVLDYNLPSGIVSRNGQRVATNPANTRKGGGIFLHVNGTSATAGCVSVSRSHMRRILRWLDPALDPVIVMGPRAVIDRM